MASMVPLSFWQTEVLGMSSVLTESEMYLDGVCAVCLVILSPWVVFLYTAVAHESLIILSYLYLYDDCYLSFKSSHETMMCTLLDFHWHRILGQIT
jgi:hypothetical protein